VSPQKTVVTTPLDRNRPCEPPTLCAFGYGTVGSQPLDLPMDGVVCRAQAQITGYAPGGTELTVREQAHDFLAEVEGLGRLRPRGRL